MQVSSRQRWLNETLSIEPHMSYAPSKIFSLFFACMTSPLEAVSHLEELCIIIILTELLACVIRIYAASETVCKYIETQGECR